MFGKTLDEMFIYLICEDSIVASQTEKIDGGYTIDVDLDPNLSTVGYKNQMKNVSNLDKLPSFANVHLKFTLDTDLKLKKLTVDENYTATMVVDAKTHGMLDIYYYSDTYVKIPEINEQIEYKKGE